MSQSFKYDDSDDEINTLMQAGRPVGLGDRAQLLLPGGKFMAIRRLIRPRGQGTSYTVIVARCHHCGVTDLPERGWAAVFTDSDLSSEIEARSMLTLLCKLCYDGAVEYELYLERKRKNQ